MRRLALLPLLLLASCKDRDPHLYLPAKPVLGEGVICGALYDLARDGTRWVNDAGTFSLYDFSLEQGRDRLYPNNVCWTKVSEREYRIEQALIHNPKLKLLQSAREAKQPYDYAVCTGTIRREDATLTVALAGPVPECAKLSGTYLGKPREPEKPAVNAGNQDTPCGRYTACVCALHRAMVLAGKSGQSPFGESCSEAEAMLRRGVPDDGYCEVGRKMFTETAKGLVGATPPECR